ncbi:MAG TPA: TerC family protein [Burkholderiaceae bacterium]|nr:TerC family protein [Burkholderiaceae bacterium]
MMEFLENLSWITVFQIIMVDVLLGGDNAVVIALACRNLPAERRMQGILWGTGGAIALRVVLIIFALTLLALPFVKLVGGALLLWIGVKLMVGEDGTDDIQGGSSLMSAIKTIILADFVMSLDNVVAIAGAAQSAHADHQVVLIIFGLLVSVPIIIWGSTVLLKLLDRFPIIVTLGAGLLGWIAAGMLITDVAVVNRFGPVDGPARMAIEIGGALFVVAMGYWLGTRRNAGVQTERESA